MVSDGNGFALVAPRAGMFDAWYALFASFAHQVGADVDDRIARTIWRWLLDGSYRIAAVFALDESKRLVGIAHYRPFPDLLTGTELCALDVLAVDEAYRRSGLERRLIGAVCEVASQRGWGEVRATIQDESAPLAGLEGIAARTRLVTYRIPIAVART
jgi:GNAT superfamily N-acetyltransferase